ncbi:MAG: NnrS family protein [Acetobacteraceae bacterium]
MPLFQHAFRPLFLSAALWAVVALVLWIGVLTGSVNLPTRLSPTDWHIHEMLFGFVMAGIGGFLLTAIPNWTGRAPLRGLVLATLTAVWAAGRGATMVGALVPEWLAMSADLAYPLLLFALAARELVAARNRRNLPLLVPLGLLFVADLSMHLDHPDLGWRLGLGCVMVLIAVIGGRITPAFTRNWLRPRGGPDVPEAGPVDHLAIVASVVSLLLWVAEPDASATGWLLMLAAGLHLLRLMRWHGPATRSEPLLLALHLGYLWMAVSLALLGVAVLTAMNPTWSVPLPAAIHAMTAGTNGRMMLAVMARATLGHTGRALRADRATVAAFALVGLAALARIAAAWNLADPMVLLGGSALAWIGAFALFVGRYGPMLLRPRL